MISLPREKEYPEGITLQKKNVYDEGTTDSFLPKDSGLQPAPIGFICPPPSEQFSTNLCVTQATYNSSYKLTLYDAAGRNASEKNQKNKIEKKSTSTETKGICVEACVTYCIISIVTFVIISVIVAIVYFLIQHPKLARAIHEAINAHADDNNGTLLKTNHDDYE